jgi:hypothetical protein
LVRSTLKGGRAVTASNEFRGGAHVLWNFLLTMGAVVVTVGMMSWLMGPELRVKSRRESSDERAGIRSLRWKTTAFFLVLGVLAALLGTVVFSR